MTGHIRGPSQKNHILIRMNNGMNIDVNSIGAGALLA
jgi:hypothetical protein